jgi:O-antigen/teichoic acid export membrane protein
MLLKHTTYNLIGLGTPLLVAVLSIPILIDALGVDRFGLLTLIWAVVSYFGLFDLGLGRAMTQQLAVVIAHEEHERIGPLIATATVLMAGLGVLAGVLMAVVAPWGIGLVRGVPDQQEAIHAVYAMALAMPAIILTSGFRGILEAKHAFGIVNLIRFPMGLFTFLGPLAVVIYGEPRLDWIACVLTVGRVIACLVHAWCAWRVLPREYGFLSIHAKLLRPLSVSGGWMTVSNIISPFMGYVDRFVIGFIVSASAVAYYTIPQELVIKLWIVPGALTMVLFPTFAAQIFRRDEQAWVLFKKAVHWLFVVLLPVTVAFVLFAHELLSLWISPELATHSTILLQIFAVGILINCMAHVPFTLIQSAGASRLTALAHTAELPFFLGVLWWLTSVYGVLGAAIAWLTRMVIDTVLMFALCSSLLEWSAKALLNARSLGMALLGVVAFAGVLFQSEVMRAIWIVVVLCLAALTLVPLSVLVRWRSVHIR